MAAALEPVSARGWPPREVEALGGWRLHAAAGYSGRANACWPIGDPGLPLDAAIDAAEQWYGRRGLAPLFRPADLATTTALRQALAERGYRPRKPTLVMTGPLSPAPAVQVASGPDPDPGFEALFLASAEDPGDAAERLEAVTRIAPPRAFACVSHEGMAVAAGATAVDGDWAGLFAMRTAPAHRRQGLARAIVGALSAFADQAGARRAYLQVEAASAPAVGLYEGLGFKAAYSYRFWSRDG